MSSVGARSSASLMSIASPFLPQLDRWQNMALSVSICSEAKTVNAAPVRLGCLHRFCPHRRTQMPRFVLSSFALVGVIVTAQPVFADRLAATVSDHA
jgi:hypothetical protein